MPNQMSNKTKFQPLGYKPVALKWQTLIQVWTKRGIDPGCTVFILKQ